MAMRDAEAEMTPAVEGLRLPTARDLARAQTVEELIAACAPGGDAEEIEAMLAKADPLCSIALNAECCLCGGDVRAEVDLAARWLSAQRRIACGLLEEVHMLARHYHWSEREILGLSESRRQYYIALCQVEQSAYMEQSAYV
jgi:hypothetical protein